jgi:hypothetical protein
MRSTNTRHWWLACACERIRSWQSVSPCVATGMEGRHVDQFLASRQTVQGDLSPSGIATVTGRNSFPDRRGPRITEILPGRPGAAGQQHRIRRSGLNGRSAKQRPRLGLPTHPARSDLPACGAQSRDNPDMRPSGISLTRPRHSGRLKPQPQHLRCRVTDRSRLIEVRNRDGVGMDPQNRGHRPPSTHRECSIQAASLPSRPAESGWCLRISG